MTEQAGVKKLLRARTFGRASYVFAGISSLSNLGDGLVYGVKILSLLGDFYKLIAHGITYPFTWAMKSMFNLELGRETFDAAFSIFLCISIYISFRIGTVVKERYKKSEKQDTFEAFSARESLKLRKFFLSFSVAGFLISLALGYIFPELKIMAAPIVFLSFIAIFFLMFLVADIVYMIYRIKYPTLKKEPLFGALGMILTPGTVGWCIIIGFILHIPAAIITLNKHANVALPPVERFAVALDKSIEEMIDGSLRKN